MKYYLAPLEGITTNIYRNAYHKYFLPVDKYFTPFLVPHEKKGFSAKEEREVLPEQNPGLYLVPQILSNDAKGFLNTVNKLKAYGYREVNLNLGCPSKTVVSKSRGSGFLEKTEELNKFLEQIYNGTDVEISIKTRIGKNSPEEFAGLLQIYNQYPVKELIIHPRVQQDFYKNKPNLQVFEQALRESKAPVCYNGDIFCVEDYECLTERFPQVDTYMLGRGIIGNPGLLEEISHGLPADAGRLQAFHDEVLEGYLANCFGEKNALFKMKEIWCYMGGMFPENGKLLKKIKKAQHLSEYQSVCRELFALLSETVAI